ncbi:4-hydroxy-2-oxoglutarate aldolase, mitochondrial-like [Ornithodoros turicata]|uniref:4-hydroxy-2-oxoglutarate aldolase, mitochondrial-like n=1 Tax=Ornithodoros turicata TaxID=34597 RepID=UPI0031386F0F
MLHSQRLVSRTASIIRVRRSSSKVPPNLTGVFPPITTPFKSSGDVCYKSLEENLQLWSSVPFRGYVVHGSTGECALLNRQERLDILKAVKRAVTDDKEIIVGVGLESTRDTVELAKESAALGADAVLVVTPWFYKGRMTPAALEAHYATVADQSPVPVVLYSVPSNTGVELPAEVVVRLAAHPNIVGFKDSGGDVSKLALIAHGTSDTGFKILAGSAGFLLPAMEVGAAGGVCALANVLGGPLCDLYDLHVRGKRDEARVLQQRLVLPNIGVTKQFGIAGVKAAMEWFGFKGGPVRRPLLELDEQERRQLMNTFVGNGFLPK